LWFEFAKISPLPIPKEFGDISQINFDKWWGLKRELFLEPPEKPPLSEVKSIDKRKRNTIYLEVDLTGDPDSQKKIFNNIIYEKSKYKPSGSFESKAQFQPCLSGKHIKYEVLEDHLKILKMMNAGLTTKEIYEKQFGKDPEKKDQYALSRKRSINRQKERVKQILENISKRTFP